MRLAVTCGAMLGVLALLLADPAAPTPAVAAAASLPTSASASAPPERVVLVGVTGLRWSDLDPATTPRLWSLAGRGGSGALSVRGVRTATCPLEGWLAVGAGQRVDTLGDDVAPAGEDALTCRPLAAPETPAGAAVRVPQWDAIRRANDATDYEARLGTLGTALRAARRCATAVGPGAAAALAEPDGSVPRYAELPGLADVLDDCPVTVVDAGTLLRAGRDGRRVTDVARLRAADAVVGDVLTRLEADGRPWTLLVSGVADSALTPHLGVAMAVGVAPDGRYDATWLGSRSTRQRALVQATDTLPTVLALLDLHRPATAVGSPWRPGDARDRDPDVVVGRLVDMDTAAQVVRGALPTFFTLLVLSQLLLYGAAAVALRRRWGGTRRRLQVLRATRIVALVFASVPVSTYLANLAPWWRAGAPLAALLGCVAAAVTAVAVAAQAGPWRRFFLGPVAAVALVTGAVLVVDVVAGSRLQLSSLMGYSPLVAGRFFGFGNIAFALLATATLLGAACAADVLLRRGRRREAVALVVAVGGVVVAVDGWPAWGSDFGGVLALVPGFAVLGLLVAGATLSWRRLALAGPAGAVVVTAVAVLDWARGADDRSHLGRFVQQVLDGEAVDVVRRKLLANLSTFTNYRLAVLVPVAFVFVVLVLLRPAAWHAAALVRAYDRAPALRYGVLASLVALGVGFAVNDSGIAIPAVALTLGVPLLLAASARALELDEHPTGSAGAATTPAPPARGAARA